MVRDEVDDLVKRDVKLLAHGITADAAWLAGISYMYYSDVWVQLNLLIIGRNGQTLDQSLSHKNAVERVFVNAWKIRDLEGVRQCNWRNTSI